MLFVFKFLFAYVGFWTAAWFSVNPIAGILVGLIVGHVVDYSATIRFLRWRAKRSYLAQARKEFDHTFINSLFLMFGHICGCDGVISREEIREVERTMTEMLELNRKSRNAAMASFRQARTAAVPFQTSAVQYFELYQRHPEILESTIQLFINIASADGPLNQAEERLIDTAAMIFGLDPQRVRRMKRPRSGAAEHSRTTSFPELDRSTDAYSILGCDRNTPVGEIKKNYRKLVLEYHPDTIVSKGLPEDFIKFANQKFNSIQQAYEQIKAERGFN